MAEGDTHFEVSATLRLKGKFLQDMKRVSKAIDPVNVKLKNMKALSQRAARQSAHRAREAEKEARARAAAESRVARELKQSERAATRLAKQRSREMERLTRQARKAERAMARLQRKSISRGLGTARGMMGPGGMMAGGPVGRIAGQGAMVAGAAATFGVGAAMVQGLRFNKLMEDTQNSVATMFGMFDVGRAYVGESASAQEVFQKNLDLSAGAMARILELQADTPAGMTQMLQVFGQGIAGLAKGTKDVEKMLQLTTQISLLGPALNNDYGQLGRDTMRILSGSAEQEVQVWRLLKEQFQAIGEAEGLFQKGLDHEKFTKQFNKTLTAAQRMDLFEKAMKKLGPEFREQFAKSMSGLLTTTGSKLQQIAGSFTKPLSESFKKFMARANLGTEDGKKGLLSGNMVDRWMGMARYFGNVLGAAAAKLFLAFERGAFYVDQHWSTITDNIILAFKIGGVLIQAYIAKAIAGLLLAPALMAGRAATGGAKGLFGFFSKVSKRREKMGGRGLTGSMTSFAEFTKYLKLVGVMAGPAVIAFVAIGTALAVVGFAAAAIAIYITKNWNKLVQSIIDQWERIGPIVERVYLKFDYLMGVMSDIGDALLGGGTGADKFIVLLELMEAALYGAARGIIVMLKALRFFNLHSQASADQEVEAARVEQQNAQMSFNAQAKRNSGSEDDEWETARRADRLRQANDQFNKAQTAASDISTRGARLADIEKTIDMSLTPEGKAARERAKLGRQSVLEALKGAKRGKDATTPKGGVHITNQYNQWDLRNTDPDRIMSAFIPKLESLADKRTQSYEQTEQGV